MSADAELPLHAVSPSTDQFAHWLKVLPPASIILPLISFGSFKEQLHEVAGVKV